MREILFEGKRKDNGEWVEGFLVKDTSFYGKPDNRVYIVNHEHPSGCFGRDIYIEVDLETVCEYSGMTDVNGKKIFEGSIILAKRPKSHGGRAVLGVVIFENGTFKMRTAACEDPDGYSMITDLRMTIQREQQMAYALENNFIFRGYSLEIVGHIYDNPEILMEDE